MIRRVLNRLRNIWRHSPLGRVRKNPDAIRWGIIGLGYMGETFANAIDGNKDGYVAAVASRSLSKAQKFAIRHGKCKAYGSYEEMIQHAELNLDIIYIATPVKCHYDNIKLCLENGKNVLCEKPITFTAAQLEELISLAQQHGCFLMEGMWMKCLPSFRKAKEWIESGRIGNIQIIKADFYKHEIVRPEHTIYDASKGGGVIHDFGIYALAFITEFLSGLPDRIVSQSRYDARGLDTDWQIIASLREVKTCVNLSSDFGSISKAAIIGSKGSIEWDAPFNRTNCVRLFDDCGKLIETFKAQYKFEGFEYEVDEAQKCIENKRKESNLVTLQKTLLTLHFLEQSIENQK